ncbi:hypothetical protein [Deinococcus aquatilis]|uniref:hypothetical protein n=1 Tax=Deinococcus aquatilis TaxID=519440 RepID=UPI00037BC78F|nr:hypothetical protein [Deinococcus aquatilis]
MTTPTYLGTLNAHIQRLPDLRLELMLQAQCGSEPQAFERVLALGYGISLAMGLFLYVPELLHWTRRVLQFRKQAALTPQFWTAPDPPAAVLDPLLTAERVAQVRLDMVRHYATSPLLVHVITGYLLACGYPRSAGTWSTIARLSAPLLYRPFASLRPHPLRTTIWPHPDRLRPHLGRDAQVHDYELTRVHHLTLSPSGTTVLVRYERPGHLGMQLIGVFDWILTGHASPIGRPYNAQRLMAERAGSLDDLDLAAGSPLRMDGASLARLLARFGRAIPGPIL